MKRLFKWLSFRFSHKRTEYQSFGEFLREWDRQDVCQEAADELGFCRDCNASYNPEHNQGRNPLCAECEAWYQETYGDTEEAKHQKFIDDMYAAADAYGYDDEAQRYADEEAARMEYWDALDWDRMGDSNV